MINIICESILILVLMIFFSIIDDFVLQTKLCNFKQKKWWEENYPQEKYKNDYKVALFIHSFEWVCMVFIPLTVYTIFSSYDKLTIVSGFILYLFFFCANIFIHYSIDDMKANKGYLSLKQDFIFHLLQIFLTWIFFSLCIFYHINKITPNYIT